MSDKRITLFVGHYGSGKTNIAVNYAKLLKSRGASVVIADLDIVNPYFRTKDSEKELEQAGIRLVCSEYANSNVDIPALPSELYSITVDKSSCAVLDIGGDDRGALAIGRLAPAIVEENSYDMLFVANCYRPLTRTAQDALEVIREIERAAGLRMTGLVNNSNLGGMTTWQIIKDSAGFISELSDISGLPIKFTSADIRLKGEAEAEDFNNIFYMDLQKKIF